MAFQIRSLRDRNKWTQAQFAEKLGIKYQNNVSARLENPTYGKHTLTTLKKIAATGDVGLVVWFVPFSRLVDWTTATPYVDKGLSEEFYAVPEFDQDPGIKALEAKEAEEDRLVVELGSLQDEQPSTKQPEPPSFLGRIPIPPGPKMSGAEAQAG